MSIYCQSNESIELVIIHYYEGGRWKWKYIICNVMQKVDLLFVTPSLVREPQGVDLHIEGLPLLGLLVLVQVPQGDDGRVVLVPPGCAGVEVGKSRRSFRPGEEVLVEQRLFALLARIAERRDAVHERRDFLGRGVSLLGTATPNNQQEDEPDDAQIHLHWRR